MAYYTGSVYTDKVGQVVANLTKYAYTDSETNLFPEGQCTWYAFGRAFERYGGPLPVSGDGGSWYNNVVEWPGVTKRAKTNDPVSKSIACFGDSGAGHVVFIEQVTGGNVYFTEGNSWCADGTVQKKSISSFKTLWGKTLQGYIVLTNYIPQT